MFENLFKTTAPRVDIDHHFLPLLVGGIFQQKNGTYYSAFKKGFTYSRELAHVYTREEATNHMAVNRYERWGGKQEGKWIPIYIR